MRMSCCCSILSVLNLASTLEYCFTLFPLTCSAQCFLFHCHLGLSFKAYLFLCWVSYQSVPGHVLVNRPIMPSADHINTTLTLTLNTVTSVKLPFLLLIKGMLGACVCMCVFVCVTRKTAVRAM